MAAAPNLAKLGQVRIYAPTSFKGTNDPAEWLSFRFSLKMYLGVTQPQLVVTMTGIEDDVTLQVPDFDTSTPMEQQNGRTLLAVLGTYCVEPAGSFVRNFVESESPLDGRLLWQRMNIRFFVFIAPSNDDLGAA